MLEQFFSPFVLQYGYKYLSSQISEIFLKYTKRFNLSHGFTITNAHYLHRSSTHELQAWPTCYTELETEKETYCLCVEEDESQQVDKG